MEMERVPSARLRIANAFHETATADASLLGDGIADACTAVAQSRPTTNLKVSADTFVQSTAHDTSGGIAFERPSTKETSMTRKEYRAVQRALGAALVAGASAIASADDSSIGRFGGESYAYFNSQAINSPASTWRQDHQQGLSQRMLQAYSANSAGSAWQLEAPVFSRFASDSTFRQTHPNGLSERELQALSSPGPAWHSSPTTTANAQPRIVLQPFAGRFTHSTD